MIEWRTIVVLVMASCAQSAAELAPFPCAADRRCPDKLACVPGVGCTEAAVQEAFCVNFTDCSAAGGGARCDFNLQMGIGVCLQQCDINAFEVRDRCDARHLCISGDCELDCTDGQSCPADFQCEDIVLKKVCRLSL